MKLRSVQIEISEIISKHNKNRNYAILEGFGPPVAQSRSSTV